MMSTDTSNTTHATPDTSLRSEDRQGLQDRSDYFADIEVNTIRDPMMDRLAETFRSKWEPNTTHSPNSNGSAEVRLIINEGRVSGLMQEEREASAGLKSVWLSFRRQCRSIVAATYLISQGPVRKVVLIY